MLFYTSIFVASLITALHERFFCITITNTDRSFHTSNKRIAITDSSKRDQKERPGLKDNSDLPVPSVLEGGLVSSNLGKTHSAKPVVCHDQESARLNREKKLLDMYESYKARRKEEQEPRTLEMVSKPFRREVAPWAKDDKIATRPWKM